MMRAVIRLRGGINVKPAIKETLALLRLHKVNHCVLVPSGDNYEGMLNRVKDYVTWGEVKPEILARMILKRGRLSGDRPVTNAYIKDNTKYDSLAKFAQALSDEKESLKPLREMKPVFRLHPPLGGHEGVKHSHKSGGALGYRGNDINALITKMLGPETLKKERPEKKAGARKAPAARKPASKAPAKKAPARKVPVKKTVGKAPAKKEAKK